MTTISSFPPAARRVTRLALALIAGAALLCACTQEDTPDAPDGGDRIPVTFSAGIESAAVTRTADGGNTWLPTDHIGIIMARAGTDIYASGGNGILYDNTEYAVGNIGTDRDGSTATLTPASGNPTYYPRTGKVDFYAYYPYTAKGDNGEKLDEHYIYTIDLKDQSNPAAIDVLYAEAKDVARSRTPIELSFRHVFAKVTFNVKAGDGIATADIAAMKSEDVKVKFNESDLVEVLLWWQGKTTPSKSATSPQVSAYKESTASDGADATFSVIVCPAVDVKTPVRFTVGGKTYTVTLDPTAIDGHWYSGNNYVYPVTVKRTGIEIGTCSIEDWTVENKGAGTVEKPDPANFAYIPAGTFLMGSPETEEGHNDNELQHEVTLTRGFYMAKYETTNAQFAAFLNAIGVGKDGKYSAAGYPAGLHPGQVLVLDCTKEDAPYYRYKYGMTWDAATSQWKPMNGYADCPAVFVTWYGADEYARRLGASLPTEAQWEYACRAGTTTAFSSGNDRGGLDKYSWFERNSRGTPHPVGTKLPNAWGLYDMHGNAAEWCLDSWDGGYSADPAIDPVSPFPPIGYDSRVWRGGMYDTDVMYCRSASRQSSIPGNVSVWNGFRIVFN